MLDSKLSTCIRDEDIRDINVTIDGRFTRLKIKQLLKEGRLSYHKN